MFVGHFGLGFALFGPPPPNEGFLVTSALFGWLFIPWRYGIDRHRRLRPAAASLTSEARR